MSLQIFLTAFNYIFLAHYTTEYAFQTINLNFIQL